MSIFEKLGFKKKKDSSRFDREGPEDFSPGAGADLPPMREPSMPKFDRAEPAMEMSKPSFESTRPFADSRGNDLINAKLDAIKAILDNINARIERLEKIAGGEEETPRWR
ncbi:hypothetical protein JW851_04710 [Candidatus Woesearchaeota archaeon]|nr:hypothetical protein [Candidatus Woesearchaeota archaeon]